MLEHRRLRKFLTVTGLLVCSLSVGVGRTLAQPGLGVLHPVQPCDADVVKKCATTPADGREHVYAFFISGVDPWCLGNVYGLSNYLRGLGFPHMTFGRFWQTSSLRQQIVMTRQTDPEARIMLVGYSFGSLLARRMANDLDMEGVHLDALVYLGSDYIRNTPESRPSNVGKLVNIRGHGLIFSGYDLFFNGQDIDGAQNLRLPVRHILLPSRAETATTLASELGTLAGDAHVALLSRNANERPGQPSDTRAATPVGIPVQSEESSKSDGEEHSRTSYYRVTSPAATWPARTFSPTDLPGFPVH